MSEHAWFREHVEARLAGGISADDADRFQTHLKGCEVCREIFAESAAFAESMENLFAGIGPEPGLEDRVIHRLRAAPRAAAGGAVRMWGLAAAAAALLGFVGFLLQETPLARHARPPKADPETVTAPLAGAGGFYGDGAEADEKLGWRDSDVFGLVPQTGLADNRKRMTRTYTAAPDLRAEELAGEMLANLTRAQSKLDLVTNNNRGVEFGPESSAASRPPATETPNEKEFAKGESLDRVTDKPWRARLEDDAIGKGGGGGGKNAAPDTYYTLRNEAQADPGTESNKLEKERDAGYFRPGDLAGKKPSDGEKRPAAGPDPARTLAPKPPADPAEPPSQTPQDPPAVQRKIIRSGQIEFEVDGFDSSLMQISKIVAEEGGFVATVNSEKLPNGKVKGTITVRLPPERLDTLILKLRALGDLKSQRIGAQDVTKHYTDLESRLRAARAMEERLLRIIKEGKGEVKDLLEVEKQIGVWREKIEEFEGEIKYYNNLISLSTLAIVLFERDIKTPTAASEQERVDMGIESEDVEKAYKGAQAAIAEIKGRVVQAELKMLEAGQMAAHIECEVDPERSGQLTDRFKQLGNVGRLQVDRLQTVEGGVGRIEGIQVKRLDTRFKVSIYNLTNVAPRRSVRAGVACGDVEAAHKGLIDRVNKAKGRVVNSSLNRQRADQTTGYIRFEVPTAEAEALRDAIRLAGEVMTLTATENPDTRNVTESKHGFEVTLYALGAVAPRETVNLRLAARDVADAYRTIQLKVREWGGRMLAAQLNEADRNNITAYLDLDVPREREAELGAQVGALGDTFSRSAQRAGEGENAVDSKVRYQIHLLNLAQIAPRESGVLAIEVGDVDETFRRLRLLVEEKKGRVTSSNVARQRSGRVVGRFMCDLPLGEFLHAVDTVKREGTLRVAELSKNPQVPDSPLAIGRLDITVANADLIVASDEGIGSFLGMGLRWMLLSLSYLTTGLVVVVPWALIAFGLYHLVQYARRRRAATRSA
jgi:hypothetical protein